MRALKKEKTQKSCKIFDNTYKPKRRYDDEE